MGEEKRKYPRIPINAFVRFYEESSVTTEQQYWQGIAKNYSDGGIFIVTKHPFEKGSIVTLEIPIEAEPQNMRIIQVRGIVRWVSYSDEQQGMGIEFFEFKESGYKDFNEWMVHFIG